MAEHIVAIFDTDAAADAASRDLEAAGIAASSIRRYRPHSGEGAAPGSPVSGAESASTGGGFWAWLLGEEPTAETARSYYPRDEERYLQGARAGNAVVSVVLEDASRIHEVVTILEVHHPLEMEEETDEFGRRHFRRGAVIDVRPTLVPIISSPACLGSGSERARHACPIGCRGSHSTGGGANRGRQAYG